MNIGIIKIGAKIPIDFSYKTSSASDLYCIIKLLYLSKHINNVFCITDCEDIKINDKISYLNIKNHYKNINNLNIDCLLIINGINTFYGGVIDKSQEFKLYNYFIINNFNKKLFYILHDPKLLLKQLPIYNKNNNIRFNEINNLNINIEDITINKKIVYISQLEDINNELFTKNITKDTVNIDKLISYPIHKWILLKNRLKLNKYIPKYDLVYFGNLRDTHRKNKLLNFYYDLPFKVGFYGNITNKDFNNKVTNIEFNKGLSYNDLFNELNKSLYTVIIGDKCHSIMPSVRIFESILSNLITFIDIDFDTNKKLYNNSELKDFLYIKNKEELISKINYLKNNLDEYIKILNLQYEDVMFDINEDYIYNFINILKE